METHIVKIQDIEQVTHNVRRFRVEKPHGYFFTPGQATEVSINTSLLEDEKRPFTFTCLNTKSYLEFTIKIYSDHDGITNKFGKLTVGDELIIRDVWGTIAYNGEGTFFAGGAGVTPFIAIFRQLYHEGNLGNNKLIFSNKTYEDIILRDEFNLMLGKNFINVLTDETKPGFERSYINADYIRENIHDFNQQFYICGPPQFLKDIKNILLNSNANPQTVVFEK